jgi:hypothetical protein
MVIEELTANKAECRLTPARRRCEARSRLRSGGRGRVAETHCAPLAGGLQSARTRGGGQSPNGGVSVARRQFGCREHSV